VRRAARTSRKPGRIADCSVSRFHEVGTERTSKLPALTRTTSMADDRHTSMASLAPHVTSKYDLHPHPQHSNPTSLHAKLPSRLPCTPHSVLQSGRQYFVDHCQCFATRDPHCITTHHNTSCFVHTTRTCSAYVCLPALLRPCVFFVCDLLAGMVYLMSAFLCQQTSASLRNVCWWAWM